jgi:predicted RNA-binding Zn-ribbon protein involved in translation (DUF1610 family)
MWIFKPIMPSSTSAQQSKYIRNEHGHFVCPTCGEVKEKQNTMYYHMEKHKDALPFACRYCKKQFLQKQTLDLHIRSKHIDTSSDTSSDTILYDCPFDGCKFSSITKGNLRSHCFRIHFAKEAASLLSLADGKIECTSCNKKFSSKGAFYYHCSDCITLLPSDTRFHPIQQVL